MTTLLPKSETTTHIAVAVRLAQVLLEQSERCDAEAQDGSSAPCTFSRLELARTVSSTPQRVNLILKFFASSGALSVRENQFVINDKSFLLSMVHEYYSWTCVSA